MPVPIKVEPQPPVYQYTVPTAPFAVRVVVPPLHIAITPADIDIGFADEFAHHLNHDGAVLGGEGQSHQKSRQKLAGDVAPYLNGLV